MSITDELREYADIATDRDIYAGARLCKIADRIDERHERALRESYDCGYASADDWLAQHEDAMADHGWIRRPVDADGVPIHVGDEMAFLGRMTVDATDGHNVFFFADNWADGVYCVRADELRHYHAPTVEDVLREFAANIADVLGGDDFKLDDNDELYAEYAAKLRLAEEVDE